ncbi:MAG: hypothetical protein K2X66_07490 [Cyanobacteria bacterium]|nr:hypothetical protein [Cyanobacteriota bacterium]
MQVMFAGLKNIQYNTNGFSIWSSSGRPAVKAESTTVPGMELTLSRKGSDSLTVLLDRAGKGSGKGEMGEFELAAQPTDNRKVLDHTVSRIGGGWAYNTSISPNMLTTLASDVVELRQHLDASVKTDQTLPQPEKIFARPEFTIQNRLDKADDSDFLYVKAFSKPPKDSPLYEKVKDLTQADVLLKIADQMEAGQPYIGEALYKDLLGDTSQADDYRHLSHQLYTTLLVLEASRFIKKEKSNSQVHWVVPESGQKALEVARSFKKALADV